MPRTQPRILRQYVIRFAGTSYYYDKSGTGGFNIDEAASWQAKRAAKRVRAEMNNPANWIVLTLEQARLMGTMEAL